MRLRDGCLNTEWFANRVEAAVLIEDFRRRYNEHRPHSSLGYKTPIEARWASIDGTGREKINPEATPGLSN
jgi:transposase InsO family protein